MTSRRWVFTINNPTAEDKPLNWNVRYVVYQVEKGKEETTHLQGAVWFKQMKRLSAVKKLSARAHWEVMRGTAQQAIDYCTKEDTRVDGPFEAGEKPIHQGKRSDLVNLHNDIKSGVSMDDLLETHSGAIMKFTRGFQFVSAHYLQKSCQEFRFVKCHIYWGATGTGKTRKVHELDPSVYVVDNYPWWDGYNGQKSVLFDDFYGGVPAHKMLRLLDGYSVQLPVKGGFTWAQWETVYITSNTPPMDWYTKKEIINGLPINRSSIPDQVRDAMFRRFTTIEEMSYSLDNVYITV